MRKPRVKDMGFCLACGEDDGGFPDGECISCGADLDQIRDFVGEYDEGEEDDE